MVKRIFSIFLTLLFIVTNVGYSFATHYCRGEVQNQGLFFLHARDIGCGMEKAEQPANCAHHGTAWSKKNCCEDDWQIFQITDDYTSSSAGEIAVAAATPLITVVFDIYLLEETSSLEYFNYRPPLLQRDISVLVQSFLL